MLHPKTLPILALLSLVSAASCGGGGASASDSGGVATDVPIATDTVLTADTVPDEDAIPDTTAVDPGVAVDVALPPDPGASDPGTAETVATDAASACPGLDACLLDKCGGATDLASAGKCGLESCRAAYEACHGPLGSGTCKDAFGCVRTCAKGDDACPMECMGSADYDGAQAFLDVSGCLEAGCAEALDAGSNMGLQQCILTKCRTSYETCVGPFGAKACADILKCAQGCGADDACAQECMAASSYDANLQFLELGLCMESSCPEAFEKPMENLACFTGPCMTPMNTCCGGSLMGCM